MKATIDFDDKLYRRLKIEAAKRGRTIRDIVTEGVSRMLDAPAAEAAPAPAATVASWVGSLNAYAPNAAGRHDAASIRESVARGRDQGRTAESP